MTNNNTIDAARVELLLSELRLPAIKLMWAALAARADKEGWPAARFLAALAEHEIADRGRRRIERHLANARLPAGKTLDTFDFNAVPMVSKAQVMALAAGDSWLAKIDRTLSALFPRRDARFLRHQLQQPRETRPVREVRPPQAYGALAPEQLAPFHYR